ncbi:unnamed protein product [Chilo suppressalis]|uniref:Tetraspanin n=1 Tax=Chilo suppressalis TaxID=168631 RepID=A0ABN8AX00_CHISP|nr:unnamed protein product [Chilo suppressalis]
MTTGILFFIFKDWIKQQATSGFQTFITHYREDPDQQNLIDWIQEDWLQCCGVEGPRDWDRNAYFNCSSGAVGSREACGVPFSCCRSKPQDIIRNKQCGYDVRKPTYKIVAAAAAIFAAAVRLLAQAVVCSRLPTGPNGSVRILRPGSIALVVAS